MTDPNKKHSFTDTLRAGMRHVARAVVEDVVPSIANGAERVMDTIDARILRIERRIFKRIISLSILGTGGFILLFTLFFALVDSLGWSRAVASGAIGICLVILGLILMIRESE